MHAGLTIRHWMHHVHDGTIKAAHLTGHLFHERAFWGIVAIATLIIALFTLIAILGEGVPVQEYSQPLPYGYY